MESYKIVKALRYLNAGKTERAKRILQRACNDMDKSDREDCVCKSARMRARLHSLKTGEQCFVFWEYDSLSDEIHYDWITEHDYINGVGGWIPEQCILWHTADGWY